MIVLSVWIILLGHKRGMAYLNWLFGYLFIAIISLFMRFTNSSDGMLYFMSFICIIYLVVFTAWPYLVTKEHAKDLEVQASANKEYEEKRTQEFYESISDWEPVKTYIDSNQIYELHNDKNILNKNSIPSFVKTAGITTLSVQNKHLEKASELLGIPILDLNEKTKDDDNV